MSNQSLPQPTRLNCFSVYEKMYGEPDEVGWWSAKKNAILRKDTKRVLADPSKRIVEIRGYKSSASQSSLDYFDDAWQEAFERIMGLYGEMIDTATVFVFNTPEIDVKKYDRTAGNDWEIVTFVIRIVKR